MKEFAAMLVNGIKLLQLVVSDQPLNLRTACAAHGLPRGAPLHQPLPWSRVSADDSARSGAWLSRSAGSPSGRAARALKWSNTNRRMADDRLPSRRSVSSAVS